MPTIEESVFIAAPPEEVFAYLDTPANIPEYSGNVVTAELDGEGPVRVGSRIRGTSKILGRTFDWLVEVQEHDPPKTAVSRSVEGKINFATTYEVMPEGQGTRVNYRIDADPGLGGVFGKLADALVQKAYARQVHADLATLAEILTEQREGERGTATG
ncbi:SRPBCC family protein [Sinomonas gamaensis]|uniref:SRPBCC family protein n=1 Tax=Sinomonas gamaensis TaxID=2565624 RepID=UPI0014861B5B|nr:SRPBCC family protein [Sinomonas gamaensis]